ncbi:DUF3261 domain-containing protein [Acinetobacter sp. MYb177]|jgi:hypothetical protein|uniref:DUF3261 domain-containing protein n=1 Tax=Acinetobacter johnsonii TaxID=40214 RepID=A0A1R7QFA7_ACIJO|nr:DUF3261 domain-containing protein [Acinetobacter johnsonii]SJX22964.1 hypothetical protein ACNJC6_02617 [Acinetobacter johnsonii]
MKLKLRLKTVSWVLASALLCSACQSWIPKAQGLATPQWAAQNYQRQDQIEVQWKTQSFSFLLYQQQRGQSLDMLALSLTGQQLFKLSFDGQKVDVEQRIEPMKLLPFDYVVRDILYATYPNFTALHAAQSNVLQKADTIYMQQQPVLKIQQNDGVIELDNLQVPYQMVISAVSNTLEDDQGDHHD